MMLNKISIDIKDQIADLTSSSIPAITLEPGIKVLVGLLNGRGLVTELSCQGHREHSSNAWITLNPACFKGYMSSNSHRMTRYLLAGEGIWSLNVRFFGKSVFHGIGRRRPRIKNLKRSCHIEMEVRLVVNGPAFVENSDTKSKAMIAVEKAVRRHL